MTLQRILRLLAPLTLLIAAMALVACGGDDGGDTGGKAVSSDDPQKILEQTFSDAGDKKIESGKLDLSVNVDIKGGSSQLNGPVTVKLSGPFQSLGKGKVPKFDMDLDFSGAGQNIKASATSTGTKAFLGFNGQDYAVPDDLFQQFATLIKQQQDQQSGKTLNELGLTPQEWIKDPQVDDSSKVGDTDTVKVSGAIDLPKFLADINTFLSKAGSLGIPNTGQLPSQLTDDQIKMVEDAVKSADVEIESGKDDSILRRIALKLSASDKSGSGDIDFDLSLTDLGEDQDVSAPSNTKPLNDLLSQFGGLGALGGLTGGSGGSSSGGASSDAAAKYSQCVQEAGSDQTKLQKCADLLTP